MSCFVYNEKPKYADKISKLLRQTRERNMVSMKELSEDFGMSLIHLSDLERGKVKRTPEEDEIIRAYICNFLD